jgi:hypothetical protein
MKRMTPEEQQLVQLIAREVIAQLAKGQSASTSPADVAAQVASAVGAQQARADVRPPIGGCTGDYSKFPELADRLNPPRPRTESASPAPAMSALTGIVTENQLREAIKASPAGVALLSATAKLTPLANDFARQFPQKIKRLDASAAASAVKAAGAGGAQANLPWLWWIQGQCPVVNKVVGERSSQLRTMAAARSGESLPAVVRELAQAVKTGQTAGGLLFVPSAARATCLANRCASLRAIVGTCGEAVEQGIRELGANVLIIEYPHHGPRSVSGMVDRMLGQKPEVPASVQRDLADLHRCG